MGRGGQQVREALARTSRGGARAQGLRRRGIELSFLLRCEPEGADATRLEGLVKAYVPIGDSPASERPFGFVFSPEMDRRGPYLELVAFGERHPAQSVTRSVYERAHKRVHGRYPVQ